MPELIEVEAYRRAVERAVGWRITGVDLPDEWYVKRSTPDEVAAALVGATVRGTRRRGKLLMLDLGSRRPVVGLRFGMTGRLLVDGHEPVETLEYGSSRDEPAWDRVTIRFGRRTVVLRDPRRLGGIELDPDLAALGPDAATITARELAHAVDGLRSPLKAVLLDQSRIAGLGNLLVDETLWRLGRSPLVAAGALSNPEVAGLARAIRSTVVTLSRRGGSHTGDLQAFRQPGAVCPRDATPLRRSTIGGRTTWWCPRHQL